MSREISINLNIAEHRFPLTVKSEDEEEILRKAAKLLDEKFKLWLSDEKYQALSKDKLIRVVALTVVSELLEQNRIASRDKIEKDLEEIRILLEDSIG